MSVLSLSYWESDAYWHQNNKHFAEIAPQNGGKQLSPYASHLMMSCCWCMSTDGQGTICRRNIAQNFNRLSRVHERDRQTDGRETACSERERERDFTAKIQSYPLW